MVDINKISKTIRGEVEKRIGYAKTNIKNIVDEEKKRTREELIDKPKRAYKNMIKTVKDAHVNAINAIPLAGTSIRLGDIMSQRNVKGLTGLAAQRAVEYAKGVAKKTTTIAKSIPSKWSKYATTNRTINGQEVVNAAVPDVEYAIKKIGQGIGKGVGRLAYGKIAETPASVRPNVKQKYGLTTGKNITAIYDKTTGKISKTIPQRNTLSVGEKTKLLKSMPKIYK